MKRQNLFRLAAGTALLTASLLADNPAFTLIDYPGSTATQVWGISPRGVIVGFYAAAGVNHGFMLGGNQYTAIDYPGSALTLVNGIGSQGNIVGEYALTATGDHHGFLLSDGNFTTVDYPGAATTSAIGTNGAGDIVGEYSLADNVAHGFLLSGGKFSSIDYPSATGTAVNGMNDLGDVVGGYTLGGVSHGFVLRKGQFTPIDAPGAVFTTITGTNPRGDIVGRFRDTAGVNHGFLLSDGQFTTIDFPGATFTGATAISPAGDIIGRCTVSGATHGWLLKSSEGRYTITDLGPVGPTGQPFFVTSNDLEAGVAVTSDGSEHAVVWRKGQMTDLRTLGIGISNSLAFSINSNGQGTGGSETWSSDPNREDFCGFKALGLPTWGQRCLPFVWQNGVMLPLPTLGGYNGVGGAINAGGAVAGWAENTTTDPGCPAPQKYQFKPVIWQQGSIEQLPTVNGDLEGAAIAINDAGQAVGGSGTCAAFNQSTLIPLQPLHAILWQNGKASDLGNLGGTGMAFGNLALSVNQKGQVAGISDIKGDATAHAFLWTQANGMQDLGTLPGDVLSSAAGVNDSGEVVGNSLDASFNSHPYHWQNGDMEDLNALVVGETPLVLLLACSINAKGEITGLAVDTDTGDLHAYLATPSNGGTVVNTAIKALPETVRQWVRQRLGLRAPIVVPRQ